MLPNLGTRIIRMYFEKKYCDLKDTILCLSLVDQFVREG